ncbi:DUF1054 family protein [Secundilactobacillus kimchicus]|uniref:DUF1054 family protein n=1 Tax=Secundilactobacillus kimchicus TaxID=528209 RepID=UPI0024A89C87|nr:DUF1054 family protein [Secundilactobacillus kimchicus]
MFNDRDFEVFEDPTLAGRMGGIKSEIDPKFEAIAPLISDWLGASATHIAQHLRRHKNPPMNTWIAFNEQFRGYKMTPHLMLGFWDDRLFVWLACLAEASQRQWLASQLETQLPELATLDAAFQVSGNHMAKASAPLTLANSEVVLARYRQIKQADFLVGRQWFRGESVFQDEGLQQAELHKTVRALQPFYALLQGGEQKS